jgi:hypothetical protein
MTKIEHLEKDIHRLEVCVRGLDDEIVGLQSNKHPDHTSIGKKVKELISIRKLLERTKDDLENEVCKDKNQSNDDRQKEEWAFFNQKSNSYSVVRNSYVRPKDD